MDPQKNNEKRKQCSFLSISVCFGIIATIRSGQEIPCPPYTGFFFKSCLIDYFYSLLLSCLPIIINLILDFCWSSSESLNNCFKKLTWTKIKHSKYNFPKISSIFFLWLNVIISSVTDFKSILVFWQCDYELRDSHPLSLWQYVTLSHCHTFTLSHSCTITLSHSHIVTL